MDSITGLFWQIAGKIANCTIRKNKAAGTRIWGSNGHYMGLNLGVFWKIGVYKGTDFWAGQLDGFTGVFFGVSGLYPFKAAQFAPGSEEAAVPDYHFPAIRANPEICVYSSPSSTSGASSNSRCWFL